MRLWSTVVTQLQRPVAARAGTSTAVAWKAAGRVAIT